LLLIGFHTFISFSPLMAAMPQELLELPLGRCTRNEITCTCFTESKAASRT
jgi:hypothetical protein